MYAYCAYVEH